MLSNSSFKHLAWLTDLVSLVHKCVHNQFYCEKQEYLVTSFLLRCIMLDFNWLLTWKLITIYMSSIGFIIYKIYPQHQVWAYSPTMHHVSSMNNTRLKVGVVIDAVPEGEEKKRKHEIHIVE